MATSWKVDASATAVGVLGERIGLEQAAELHGNALVQGVDGVRETVSRWMWDLLAEVWNHTVFHVTVPLLGLTVWRARVRDLRPLWRWLFGKEPDGWTPSSS